jgi:lipopolysaccharide/colanic/teichoic acid biosynthesis glycosyltransferase
MNRVFDVICASAGLVLLSPLFALIALAVKMNGGGPVFYRQPRVGKDGEEFYVVKFRSMNIDADRHGLLTVTNDKRVTRVGRFLREFKLDELPQLINVVKSEMRLVGPRPEVRRYVEMFPREYNILLQDLPGITDPASLAYRHEEEMLKGEYSEEYYVSNILPHKLRRSLEYSRSRNLSSDLRVILQTLGNAKPPKELGPSSRRTGQQPSYRIPNKK